LGLLWTAFGLVFRVSNLLEIVGICIMRIQGKGNIFNCEVKVKFVDQFHFLFTLFFWVDTCLINCNCLSQSDLSKENLFVSKDSGFPRLNWNFFNVVIRPLLVHYLCELFVKLFFRAELLFVSDTATKGNTVRNWVSQVIAIHTAWEVKVLADRTNWVQVNAYSSFKFAFRSCWAGRGWWSQTVSGNGLARCHSSVTKAVSVKGGYDWAVRTFLLIDEPASANRAIVLSLPAWNPLT